MKKLREKLVFTVKQSYNIMLDSPHEDEICWPFRYLPKKVYESQPLNLCWSKKGVDIFSSLIFAENSLSMTPFLPRLSLPP